jgi:hypothetical protein
LISTPPNFFLLTTTLVFSNIVDLHSLVIESLNYIKIKLSIMSEQSRALVCCGGQDSHHWKRPKHGSKHNPFKSNMGLSHSSWNGSWSIEIWWKVDWLTHFTSVGCKLASAPSNSQHVHCITSLQWNPPTPLVFVYLHGRCVATR